LLCFLEFLANVVPQDLVVLLDRQELQVPQDQQVHKVYKVVQGQLVQLDLRELLAHRASKEKLDLLEQQALKALQERKE
jgi:hypothetical protein